MLLEDGWMEEMSERRKEKLMDFCSITKTSRAYIQYLDEDLKQHVQCVYHKFDFYVDCIMYDLITGLAKSRKL